MVQQLLESANVGGFTPLIQYPGDNCCMLFKDNYFGRHGTREINQNVDDYRKTICHTGERTVVNLHELGWGDQVDSWYCGKSVWYDFCNDGQDQCRNADHHVSGAGHGRNYRINYNNNRMSTAILGPYDPRAIGAVTLFEDEECSGASGRLYWDPSSPSSGTMYSNEDLYHAGHRNNSMDSMLVPAGYIVELYDGDGFYGNMQSVTGAYKNDSEEMVCVAAEWGDRVSSVIVKRQPQGIANAYWSGITSTESQEQTYHVGLTTGNSSSSQYTEVDRMNAALDLGLNFLSIFFPPLALIPSQRNDVQRDVTTTYGYDYHMENTTTCTKPAGSTTSGVGLWQWVVSTEDGSTMSFSQHTVCRTGENWNTPPACPYYACENADCSQCATNWSAI